MTDRRGDGGEFASRSIPERDWLIIDIEGPDVTIATTSPKSGGGLQNIRHYDARMIATATDCLQKYAVDCGLPLLGRQCAIIVSGAVKGDTLRIMRCPWVISLRGIGHLVGHRPVAINDIVANAWANRTFSRVTHRSVGGTAEPDYAGSGRWITVSVAEGVGAAIMSTDETGAMRILDSELGHCGFPPETDNERAIAATLAKRNPNVSWEWVLTLKPEDPIWQQAGIMPSAASIMRAELLGAFCGDAVLAVAAWSGIFIAGQGSRMLLRPEQLDAFTRRFERKATYGNLLRATPRWLSSIDNARMRGGVTMLASTQSIQ